MNGDHRFKYWFWGQFTWIQKNSHRCVCWLHQRLHHAASALFVASLDEWETPNTKILSLFGGVGIRNVGVCQRLSLEPSLSTRTTFGANRKAPWTSRTLTWSNGPRRRRWWMDWLPKRWGWSPPKKTVRIPGDPRGFRNFFGASPSEVLYIYSNIYI